MIQIELTDKEAEIFIALRKANVPDIFVDRGAKIILNFAKGGTLINITLNDFIVYQRKRLDKDSC